MKQPIIGFAGMTHLGINSAVAAAERGFHTICFDTDEAHITQLKNHTLSVNEPDLPELLSKNINANKLEFITHVKDLHICDIVYISTDVPTDNKGISDLSAIYHIIQIVAANLNPTAVLVILCQVPPGFTRQLNKFIPLTRLYYQVETLIFGRAIERALYPERIILGCAEANTTIDSRFRTFLDAFNCPLLPMRYESAELAKISINCCLVASIGVANTLSEVCEKIGANWQEIIPALKLDKRIGPYSYLTPGLGIAGGNLERDLTTIIHLSEQHGTDAGIVKSWVQNSQYRKDWVLKMLHKMVLPNNPNPTLAVLGLAYKENTHSIKNSPSIALLECLMPYCIHVYDPIVSSSVVSWAQGKDSVKQALDNADVLILMTPWSEFKNITPQLLKENMRGKFIIDPYRILNGSEFENEGFYYLTLGMNVTC